MGGNSSKYEGGNDRHAERGGEQGDEEGDIRPETLEAVFNHGLPKAASEGDSTSE